MKRRDRQTDREKKRQREAQRQRKGGANRASGKATQACRHPDVQFPTSQKSERAVSVVRRHPGMWCFVTSTLGNPNTGPEGRKNHGQHYKWKTGKVKPAR